MSHYLMIETVLWPIIQSWRLRGESPSTGDSYGVVNNVLRCIVADEYGPYPDDVTYPIVQARSFLRRSIRFGRVAGTSVPGWSKDWQWTT